MAKVLSLNVSAEKLLSMTAKDKEKHCASLIESLSSLERGPTSAKHVQLIQYCGSIASVSGIADLLARQNVLTALAHQTKETQQIDMLVFVLYY